MTKRIISVLLALVLVLALAMPAMAANLAVSGENDYVAYQIFTGEYEVDGNDKKVFANAEFGSHADQDALNAWLAPEDDDFTATEAVEAIASLDMKPADLAAKLLTCVNDEAAIELPQNVETGYYLLQDVTEEDVEKSAYILNVYDVDVTVEPKLSGVPVTDKKIDENGELKNVSAYDYGDVIEFDLTATVPVGFDNYDTYTMIFKDTMETGLTYQKDAKIVSPAALVNTPVTHNEDGFEIKIDDLTVYEISASTVIKVEYTAVLNENAEIGQTGNVNEFTLDYTNGPETDDFGTTAPVSAVVFTFELDGDKIDGATEVALADAEFYLMRGNEYAQFDKETLKLTGWTSEKTQATKLVSDSEGNFGVKGLKDGVYTLIEETAPQGYNKLIDNITFTIDYATTKNDNTEIALDVNAEKTTVNYNGQFQEVVENNAGTQLPSTGGIGTTIFYLVGGLMMAAAVVLLVAKKRTVNE